MMKSVYAKIIFGFCKLPGCLETSVWYPLPWDVGEKCFVVKRSNLITTLPLVIFFRSKKLC